MDIQYKTDLSDVSWQRLTELFEAVGWDTRPPEDLKQACERSTYVRFAYHRNKIVGTGRIVSDGKYYAMIVDLAVDPAYQGNGIGSTILRQLTGEIADYWIVSLRAAEGKEPFYLKRGWKKSKSAYHWSRTFEDQT